MSNKREVIFELFLSGKKQSEISRLLNVPKQTVSDAIRRFKELGHSGRRPGSGRKRTINISSNRQIISKRIKRNSRLSMRKVARETGLKRESVRMIAKNELQLRPYKIQKVQLLTDENRRVRLQRCRVLKQRAAGQRWERILFSDEKLFTIEQAHNLQNDRIWTSKPTSNFKTVERRQNPESVMVWGGICASGKTPLIFVDKGVKINQELYRRDILESVLLPWSKQHFKNEEWIFQQDSAPAHKAKKTQEWCKSNFPDFITSQEWPPYSPDLNPMDYSIWSILETRVCAKRHKNLEALKKSMRREWDCLSPNELRPIAENFTKRLASCIREKGGHFETK